MLATPENVASAGIIEITITRDGGTTVLRVVNSGFLDEAVWDDVFEDTRLGWIGALALLQQYLERGAGWRLRRFLHMRPTHAAYETVVPWLEEERRLQQWLATSGQPRAPGKSFDIVLRDAGARTARVIARTPRTMTLAFDGEPETLELLVFTNRLRTATGEALDRLVALLNA